MRGEASADVLCVFLYAAEVYLCVLLSIACLQAIHNCERCLGFNL